MKTAIFFLLFVILGALPAFAEVLEDSRIRFVLQDEVLDSGVHACDSADDAGATFDPERVAFLDGNPMPFRYYRVAVPTAEKPAVSVTDLETVPLGKPLCRSGQGELKFTPVDVSAPVMRDGLWIVEIRVPLYVKHASSVALRKSFRLDVRFAGSVSGVNPGKRALSRVLNPKAAARFGQSRAKAQKALRKSAVDQTSDVTFLANFQVGDKNMATFSEDGLYAVDFKTIRSALTLLQRQYEMDGIPVDRICLYGASPDTLADSGPGDAERNPNHIFEIPIEIIDHSPDGSGADGIFNEGDTLLFVGYGNAFWKRCDRENSGFVNGKMDYFHSYSPYSFYQNFLFGFKGSGKGLRLAQKVAAPSGAARDVAWLRYVRAEKDALLRDTFFKKSLDWESATGKEWFWLWHSRLDSVLVSAAVLNTEETVKLPGLVEGGRQYVAVTYFPHRSVFDSAAAKDGDQSSDQSFSSRSYDQRMEQIAFAFEVNGKRTHRSETDLIPGGNFRIDAPGLLERGNSYSLEMLPNPIQFDRFDGYSVAYQWTPVVDSAEWLLPGAISGIVNVPVPSGVQVMKFKDLQPVGMLSSASGVAKDSIGSGEDVRYLAVRTGAYRSGLKVTGIPVLGDGVLTDLGRPNSKLEYLIIAPSEFIEPAKALAEFRSDGSAVTSFSTSVVAVEDIYRRYTGGRVSPVAIRNYISYVYSVCPNLRYVLLAGSGHFDYRGLNSRLTTSYIPPFEKEDAVVEDFFAILDSGETCQYGVYDLDVAVGRLPVLSVTEFSQYIEKAKEYEKKGLMDYSVWRSTLLLAADDAMNSGRLDRMKHTEVQESVANTLDKAAAEKEFRINMKKVYLLDYTEDAAGQKKEAAEDFINILNQGALFATYFGHGSKTDWASEGLLKPSYISKLSNQGRYTILSSFSCTVGRFDEGKERSLSEQFLMAPSVGAIASIGAARESFFLHNSNLGRAFMQKAVIGDGETIGSAFVKAKMSSTGSSYSELRYNNERYLLLGEPVLRMPPGDLKITLDASLDTVHALDKMHLSGTVSGMDEGFIDIALREGRVTKNLDLQLDDDSFVKVFYDGPLIFSEKVPVKAGRFETDFITPRKISIGDTAAEFSAWAYSSNMSSVGRLWKGNLVIGGISSYADSLQDTVPPTIRLQSCYGGGTATDFVDGQTVKLQSPACVQVVVEDSTALDFREQADEGISFEVVGVQNPFHPWPYLEQNSKRAKLRMSFSSELYPAGKYQFKVRAMDVLNNVSVKTLNVEITEDLESGLVDVFNVPNPMGKKGTTFYFKNLAVDRDSRVNIFIYNQNGKLVKVIKDAVSGVTHWDGRDNHGRPLANGLYHYVVRSEVSATKLWGKKTWTKKQKLLISR